MKDKSIQPGYNEARYRKAVRSSIFSIIFFVIVYLIMLAIAVGLFLGLGALGILIISRSVSGPAIALGCFLIFLGTYFVVMLIRFLFQSSDNDLYHLIELAPQDEPELFEIVNGVATSLGHAALNKIYLSADVNASVFHHSSFLSLFFPVKKHLSIGLGLLDAVTVSELKAIIAHEFGHFSQKSMRLGAYVGIVNRSIHGIFQSRMLGANQSSSQAPTVVESAVNFAALVASPMALILEKVFLVVNKNYLALSREMEYHADAVASETVGSAPFASGLLRISLAQNAHQSLINYYENKVVDGIKTDNFFEQSKWMLAYLGMDSRLEFNANLPQVTVQYVQRFNKSKLRIGHQWESHPNKEDRIRAIEALGFEAATSNDALASSILQNLKSWQIKGTREIFLGVPYSGKTSLFSKEEFIADFKAKVEPFEIDPIFNGYYDEWLPQPFDLDNVNLDVPYFKGPIETLFSNEVVNSVLETNALENDLGVIEQIAREKIEIKSYEYDGKKYRAFDSPALYRKLKAELEIAKEKLLQHSQQIFSIFYEVARSRGLQDQLKAIYKAYFEQFQSNQKSADIQVGLLQAAEFFTSQTPFNIIYEKMKALKVIEEDFRVEIRALLENEGLKDQLSSEMKLTSRKYLSKNWMYFFNNKYDEHAIAVLNDMIALFPMLLHIQLNLHSRELFMFQASLMRPLAEKKERL